MNIEQAYRAAKSATLEPAAKRLEGFLQTCLADVSRIDRISVRVKSVERFLKKASKKGEDGNLKYDDPLSQIQDQIGARIVCFYLQDVEQVSAAISENFNNIENRLIQPDEHSKFGYFGKHFILHLPDDVIDDDNKPAPPVFELQIKTLFQHAWSEAEHDLAYKPIGEISPEVHRKIAFTAAQAWGADMIFEDLFSRLSAANDASKCLG